MNYRAVLQNQGNYQPTVVHRLVSITAAAHGVGTWHSETAKALLHGASFHDVFGIMPQNAHQERRMQQELKNRPFDCDGDHLNGRKELWMNGIGFIMATSHRENSMRSVVRRGAKTWLFGFSGKKYIHGQTD
jgi:hypothetical protein